MGKIRYGRIRILIYKNKMPRLAPEDQADMAGRGRICYGGNMDWATIATIVGVILTTFTINRLFAGRRADKIDRRFDDLTKRSEERRVGKDGRSRWSPDH